MNHLISTIKSIMNRVVPYKLSGITIKTPFINFSFAPVKIMSSPQGGLFVSTPICNRKLILPKLKIKVQTNAQAIKPRHYAKTAMVTLLFRTLESERYLLALPYIFSAHLAHKARKTKPKLSHAIKSHIQKIA